MIVSGCWWCLGILIIFNNNKFCIYNVLGQQSHHIPGVVDEKRLVITILRLHHCLFHLHFPCHSHALLSLNIILILLAGTIALTFFFLALGEGITFGNSLFEFPAGEGASFLVLVDDKAGSCDFESEFLDGLSNGNSLFQHHLNKQHSFLGGRIVTFMGILE